jgi:hypothetical protein
MHSLLFKIGERKMNGISSCGHLLPFPILNEFLKRNCLEDKEMSMEEFLG